MAQRRADETDKERVPTPSIGSPQRRMTEILYGFNDQDEALPALPENGRNHYTYSEYFRAIQKLAGLRDHSDTTIKRFIKVLREDLASELLALEKRQASERQQQTSTTTEAPPQDVHIIERDYYEMKVIEQLAPGDKRIYPVCIWGEPGTGKTVLADLVAQLLLVKPVARIRAGDEDILRHDLTEVLISEGMEPTNWSDAYSRARLRRCFDRKLKQPRPHNRILIIDNVDSEELISQLVPESLRIPIFITMRRRPENAAVRCVEVEDFTEEQSCTFIKSYLGHTDDTETRALARVLGYRPLALEHAVLFIREAPDVSLRDLIERLTTSLTEALSAVTPPAQREKNLVRLYRIILAAVMEEEHTRGIIDAFLAIAGRSGSLVRDLLFVFLHSEVGGSYDRLRFRAGLRMLGRYGLLREEGALLEPRILVMHQLTYEILRGLRGSVPFEIGMAYVEYLQDFGSVWQGQENVSWTTLWMALLKTEGDSVHEVLPSGWIHLIYIDEWTWMAIREEGAAGKRIRYTVRYEIYPHGVYKLDYRTGEKQALENIEREEFLGATARYSEKALPLLQKIQPDASSSDSTIQVLALNQTEATDAFNAVCALRDQIYSLDEETALYRRKGLAEMMRDWENFGISVAMKDGNLIGYALGFSLPPGVAWWGYFDGPLPDDFTSDVGRRTFLLEDVAIEASSRRRGIGGRLIDTLLRGRLDQLAFALVWADARGAHEFFTRLGWRRLGRTRMPPGLRLEFADIYHFGSPSEGG